MKISFHGGLCCGIKHIHGLGEYPNATLSEKDAREYEGPDFSHDKQENPDQWGLNVNSEVNAHYPEAPKEKVIERFDRYLKFLQGWRPGGIVEVVLSNGGNGGEEQIEPWEPLLFERGFKLVNSCKNSNTSNTIFVYHLNMEEEEEE